MTDLLVRDVPESVLTALKAQAVSQRRSLQQEVLLILEEAARRRAASTLPAKLAAEIRTRLECSGRTFADSATLVREDRER
jgi:antitoxin FitA